MVAGWRTSASTMTKSSRIAINVAACLCYFCARITQHWPRSIGASRCRGRCRRCHHHRKHNENLLVEYTETGFTLLHAIFSVCRYAFVSIWMCMLQFMQWHSLAVAQPYKWQRRKIAIKWNNQWASKWHSFPFVPILCYRTRRAEA